LERNWIREVGHRDVPGRPVLFGTTKIFLDYFNLKSLDELPTLAEIQDLDTIEPELALTHPPASNDSTAASDDADSDASNDAGDDEDNPPLNGNSNDSEAE